MIDEIGERALEVALSYADKNADAEVVVLSMAPSGSAATVRKGLAMGAGSAVHVADEGLVGADLGLTAEVLAAAIRRTGFDLVIAGNLSTDGSGGVMPAMVAELLDVPSATALSTVVIGDGTVSGERASDGATMQVSAVLPAVISITERLPDARFPNFKGIMAAKKKPFETVTLEDLGIEPEDPPPRGRSCSRCRRSRRVRQAPRSSTRVTRARSSPSSSSRTGWCEVAAMTFADDSILVLLDVIPAGELAQSSAGLLGAAASVGTPVALVVVGCGEGGARRRRRPGRGDSAGRRAR